MNHHERPLDMTGPEFDGLTFNEAWALKKQLRIRDRNRMINTSLWRRQHERAVRWTVIKFVATIAAALLALVIVWSRP